MVTLFDPIPKYKNSFKVFFSYHDQVSKEKSMMHLGFLGWK